MNLVKTSPEDEDTFLLLLFIWEIVIIQNRKRNNLNSVLHGGRAEFQKQQVSRKENPILDTQKSTNKEKYTLPVGVQ